MTPLREALDRAQKALDARDAAQAELDAALAALFKLLSDAAAPKNEPSTPATP